MNLYSSGQSLFEGSERHQKLLAIMKEFNIIQGGYLPYREAVEKYVKWLNKGIKPFVYKLFGEYSFRINEYEIITEQELETICDVFRSYKPKKLFSGVKMYRREFATGELYKKEKVLFTKPGTILWEVTGLPFNTVQEMARRASETCGVNIVCYDANGICVSQ